MIIALHGVSFLRGSSIDVVVRDVDSLRGQFVSTCDVGCGQPASSLDDYDGQSFASDSYSWDEHYPNPDRAPDLTIVVAGRRIQLRDVARQFWRRRLGWLYDLSDWHVKWDRRLSSVWARPPSEWFIFMGIVVAVP